MFPLSSLMGIRGWVVVSFFVVVMALLGWIDMGTAFYSVIVLTMMGIFYFQIPMIIPILQFSLSLLMLIAITGPEAFGTAIMVNPITVALIGGVR